MTPLLQRCLILSSVPGYRVPESYVGGGGEVILVWGYNYWFADSHYLQTAGKQDCYVANPGSRVSSSLQWSILSDDYLQGQLSVQQLKFLFSVCF